MWSTSLQPASHHCTQSDYSNTAGCADWLPLHQLGRTSHEAQPDPGAQDLGEGVKPAVRRSNLTAEQMVT